MPDPVSAGAATLAAASVAVPVITIVGISTGLRVDILLAGFAGALAALALLNTVPSTGDTWRELLRTTLRRVAVVLGSAVTAGYLVPLFMPAASSDASLLGFAFLTGTSAQKAINLAIDRWFNKGETKQ